MKYFTRELYIEYNSTDALKADRADAAWEEAVAHYRVRLKNIRKRLPTKLRDFAEKMSLHDAVYLGYLKTPMPKTAGELAVVAIAQDAATTLLIYVLIEEPTITSPWASPLFPEQNVHWLYDEIDCDDEAMTHDILLSNGQILHFRFTSFDLLPVVNSETRELGSHSTSVLIGH